MCMLWRNHTRRDHGLSHLFSKNNGQIKEQKMESIYLDNAATTKPSNRVLTAMHRVESEFFENPSSVHHKGRRAAEIVLEARDRVADFFSCKPSEIYFTSGGCESDNWAIKGVALANMSKGRHIITSEIEHITVLQSCEDLKKLGFEITYISVDNNGIVDVNELEKAIREDTILVSIMAVNNEIGTIQPVVKIAEICKKHGVLFHSDAVQAVGVIGLNVQKIGVDLLSVSSHKFHGPKGVGVLYIREGVAIQSLISGSHLRSGTWNTPGIVGTAEALTEAKENFYTNKQTVKYLRDYFLQKILSDIPGTYLNGDPIKRAQGNINVSFAGVDGEALMMELDEAGVCVSMGSACSADSLEPSRVLLAIGLSRKDAMSSIRITLGTENTLAEIEKTFKILQQKIEFLREIKS